MSLALKIKKLRELRNFTQEYVANELGLDQSAYSRLEKGETKISIERLAKIARVFDVELEDIFQFDEAKIFTMNNQHGNNGYIVNVVSDVERKLYEEQIKTLKDEITYLKETLNKILSK